MPAVMRPELRTARLHLSLFTPADAPALHAIFSDPATHTLGDGPFRCLQQTEAWIARRAQRHAEHGLAWYALREHGGEVLLGNAGLFLGRTGAEPEIGYEVSAVWQRGGLASEAAAAVVAEADRVGWSRLWATVRPTNDASLAVLARTGFVTDSLREAAGGPLVYLRRDVATTATTVPEWS